MIINLKSTEAQTLNGGFLSVTSYFDGGIICSFPIIDNGPLSWAPVEKLSGAVPVYQIENVY